MSQLAKAHNDIAYFVNIKGCLISRKNFLHLFCLSKAQISTLFFYSKALLQNALDLLLNWYTLKMLLTKN